jgi:hypothetical protein
MDQDWKEENKDIINNIWEAKKRNSFGIMMVCPTCGGPSAAFCQCAKKRFIDSLTKEQFQQYRQEYNL